MIICPNCGTTNSSEERICRICGALLPVSDQSSRSKRSMKQSKPKEKVKITTSQSNNKSKLLNLEEIPANYSETEITQHDITGNETKQSENEYENLEEEKQVLREIKPSPFSGSIITSKSVYQPSSVKKEKGKIQPLPKANESTLIKQKQLEEDMTKVLKFLSKKITVEKLPSEKKEEQKEKEKPISPTSMNEILKELLKLDLHIEASAIIKNDGTILASAISSRISDSLFATIGQSLSLIGLDIIESLNAGNLTNISLRGTQGVLDLAPIDMKSSPGNDMILIIFSNPRVKSGIIHFAANIVKKQVKEYLGFEK